MILWHILMTDATKCIHYTLAPILKKNICHTVYFFFTLVLLYGIAQQTVLFLYSKHRPRCIPHEWRPNWHSFGLCWVMGVYRYVNHIAHIINVKQTWLLVISHHSWRQPLQAICMLTWCMFKWMDTHGHQSGTIPCCSLTSKCLSRTYRKGVI